MLFGFFPGENRPQMMKGPHLAARCTENRGK